MRCKHNINRHAAIYIYRPVLISGWSVYPSGGLLRVFWGLKYTHFLRVQNEICTYWVYLMEHIFFEAQLCSEILIFKEKSNFWKTDHPGLGTSLKAGRRPASTLRLGTCSSAGCGGWGFRCLKAASRPGRGTGGSGPTAHLGRNLGLTKLKLNRTCI